jgi:hypothetical protein
MLPGDRMMLIGRRFTVAEAEMVESDELVALTVTVCAEVINRGAV